VASFFGATLYSCEIDIIGHTAGVRCVVVLASVDILSCSDDGTIRQWNTSDGTCIQMCGPTSAAIHAVALLPESTDFVCYVADCTLQIWRERTLTQTVALPEQSLSVICVLSSGDVVSCTRSVSVPRHVGFDNKMHLAFVYSCKYLF